MRNTIWGNFYTTMLKENAGENCYFGDARGDGEMCIPINTKERPLGTFKLIVR